MNTAHKFLRVSLAAVLLSFCAHFALQAQDDKQPLNRILLIYDASNSMNARWQSASRMAIAKQLTIEMLDSLATVPNLQLALRVYGHQSPFPPLDCNDTKLEVPFGFGNVKRITHVIKTLVPRGSTPIAHSLMEAAKDFPPCDNCRNIIILITDGLEECGGDACEASMFLQKQGIALRPFIIGVGNDFSKDFDCVGEYYDASNESDFVHAFEVVISQALNATTAQVNLIDAEGLPTVSNINMSFLDHVSGKVIYNYVHTLDYYGRPDTLTLDPLRVYDLVVNTMPPLRLDSIAVHTGRHNVMALKAVQGDLMVSMKGSRPAVAASIPCVVRKPGSTDIINVQYVNSAGRYLAGKYDIDVLTVPPVRLRDVEIGADKTTTVDIPMLGILSFNRSVEGYGSVYMIYPDGTQELVHNFDNKRKNETIYLRPGTYRVVNRSKYNLRTSATREKIVVLNPGASVSVSL